MRRVAITGGIAEGKSTLLAEFATLGVRTGSADEMARSVFALPAVQRALAALLGAEPPIGPEALREAIGRDASLRRRVNQIMHPAILGEIEASKAQIIEVPLLIETCLHPRFDAVIVATCGLQEQRRRLLERYGDSREVDRLLATQLPTRAKLPFAHEIVRTDRPFQAVREHATGVLTRLRLV